MKFTSVLAAGTAAVLALGLAACGSSGEEGGGGTDDVTITMLPKNLGNPYFEASTAGAQEAAGELSVEVSEVGPDTASPDAQVPFINTAAQQGVSALVVSANDPTAIGDALEEARSAGTKVVTFDSDTEPQFRDLFVNQASAEGIADKQLELVADQIGGKGEIAILSASANATNQNAWIAIMEEKLASDYPDIELVETAYGDDDDQTSFDKTAALLQSHPDLKGIVSPTTVGIAAAARYVSTSEYKGKVAVTGLGTPNQMREYVEDGTVEAFALWNPSDLGYLATQAAAALVAGDITGEEGDTFEAGRLGKFAVGANGEVLLGDPYVYDESNIADFDF